METQLHILVPAQLGLACRQGVAGLGRRQGDGELGACLDGDGLRRGGVVVLGLFHPDLIGSGGQGQFGAGPCARRKRLLPRFPHFVCGNLGFQGHIAVILAGNRFVVSLHLRNLRSFPDGHGKGVACQLVSITAGRYLVGVNADIHRPIQRIGCVLPHFGFASVLHLIPLIAHPLAFRSR